MTNRQTLPELLARITADRHAAELESLNRVIAEERARANRCRDEAVSLRDMLDDVIESLELFAPVPDEPQPEGQPAGVSHPGLTEEAVQTLYKMTGVPPERSFDAVMGGLHCHYDGSGAGRRARLSLDSIRDDILSSPLAEGLKPDEDPELAPCRLVLALLDRLEKAPPSISVAELAEVLGCDADADSVRVSLRYHKRTADRQVEADFARPDAEGWYTLAPGTWPTCSPADYVDADRGPEKAARDVRADRMMWEGVTRWRHAGGRATG